MSSIEQTILDANLKYLRPSLPAGKPDNFAFLVFAMMTILDIEVNEALKSITEGADDNSIDGIYIDQTENDILIHIFQSKYRTNLAKPIGKNDIDLTLNHIGNILRGVEPNRSSASIKRKVQEIRDTITEYGTVKLPWVRVYFVTNGAATNDSEKESVKEFENNGNHEVHFLTTSDLLNILDTVGKKNYSVNITTKGPTIPQDVGNIRGLLCTINASELIRVYNEGGRDNVLDRNIRFFLGSNSINQKIQKTAESEEDSKYFWFLNNGISIVCDKFTPTDDLSGNKVVQIKNPKIINGGQTTKTLYELDKKNEIFSGKTLKDVYVLARIYETDDNKLIEKITEGTNSQNATFIRDLKSNNPIQKRVKQYFKLKGFYLEIKRKEYRNENPPIPLSKIIKNDTVLQAYLSLYQAIPHQAKTGKSKAFEEYFNSVFSEINTGLPKNFFRSFELLNFVNKKEEDYNTDNGYSFLLHADCALIFTIGILWPEVKVVDEIDMSKLENVYKKAVTQIRKVSRLESEELGEAYSHNKFFKSSNSTIKIQNQLKVKSKGK